MASDSNGGIAALFSMYNDDDEDEELPQAPTLPSNPAQHSQEDNPNPPSPSPSPGLPEQGTEAPECAEAIPAEATPSPRPGSSRRLSPLPPITSPLVLSRPASERRAPTVIVDYEHDEMALSPEPEEGEISGYQASVNIDTQVSAGIPEEQSPSHTVGQLTQLSDENDQQVQYDVMMEITEMEGEITGDEDPSGSTSVQTNDALARFLPPPVNTKCSKELQDRISKFLEIKKQGRSFNAELRIMKDYRNPDFLQHAVRYQNIDEIGSCFAKDVFDPHGYDKSDYYDGIEAEMKREAERKEKEKQKNQKVDFVGGGLQLAAGAMILKTATGVLSHAPAAVDVSTKDSRQNKKSKWDKVDGDVKNLASGADSLSAIAKHASLLASSNAGSGYSAFLQQRRKEAEEKKSLDKRSS